MHFILALGYCLFALACRLAPGLVRRQAPSSAPEQASESGWLPLWIRDSAMAPYPE